MRIWGGLLLTLAATLYAQTADRSPYHESPKDIDVGRASFRLRCSACHGIHAEGGQGPALNRGEFNAGDTDMDIYRVIALGVRGTEMPAFGTRNTEDNIWRIVSYLRTFEPSGGEAVEGDASNGEQVFWNAGGCGACHRIGRKGGAFGPPLGRIGRSRSVAHLRESILAPDQDLPPGYYLVEVVTADGATVRGIGLGYDDFSAQLRDSAGRLHSYLRDDVRSIKREFASLMPGNYAETLSETQQRDLVAYMQSLRGEETNP